MDKFLDINHPEFDDDLEEYINKQQETFRQLNKFIDKYQIKELNDIQRFSVWTSLSK